VRLAGNSQPSQRRYLAKDGIFSATAKRVTVRQLMLASPNVDPSRYFASMLPFGCRSGFEATANGLERPLK
jgi:hypothetical protein